MRHSFLTRLMSVDRFHLGWHMGMESIDGPWLMNISANNFDATQAVICPEFFHNENSVTIFSLTLHVLQTFPGMSFCLFPQSIENFQNFRTRDMKTSKQFSDFE